MALTTNKATTLSGYSIIKGEQALILTANITKDNAGKTYINQTVLNQDLYNGNRTECRKDISAFNELVYDIEDEFIAEKEKDTEGK